ISILRATRVYLATCAAEPAPSFVIMALSRCRIRIRTAYGWEDVRRKSTRCVSPRASCGDRPPHRTTAFIWTCGRTTLSAAEASDSKQRITARLDSLPPLPRDEEGPVFAEPWQAQAFAMAVKLSEQGHFTWKEWASALADEITAAQARGESDDGS